MKSSIIIPTYNRSVYLQQTIYSVLNQTIKNLEIIVIDDNSTDNTKEVVNEISKRDSRVHLIIKPKHIKKGPCSSRNLGIAESSGEFVIFLDSDDLLMPYCLSQRIEQIKKFPDFTCWVFNGAGFKNQNFDSLLLWNIPNTKSNLERFFALDVPWQTTGPIWNKKALTALKLKWDSETEPWDDVDFHVSGLLNKDVKCKVFWESKYDYLFRISSSDSISQTDYFNPQKIEARFYFFLKYYNLLDQHQIILLRPTLLNVLQTCVVIKKYFKAYEFIKLAYDKKIITLQESLFIRNQIFKKHLFRNRFFKFPTTQIKRILNPIEPSTLKVLIS